VSYSQYYGNIAAGVGRSVSNATNLVQTQQSAVAQAQNVRKQLSGVSLDEEATILIQFQRAYEANSRLISVLNQLTQDTINILPNA
jgi:flagellar hook-associated protein 1 FlgK